MKFIFFLIMLQLSFIGCRKEKIINFDNSEPLALAPDIQWAVITYSYTSFKKNYSWNSVSQKYCRKGEIFKILGKTVDEDGMVWYCFEEGWLSENVLSVYSNRFKAQKAASFLNEDVK